MLHPPRRASDQFRPRARAATASVLLLAGLLAGCGDGNEAADNDAPDTQEAPASSTAAPQLEPTLTAIFADTGATPDPTRMLELETFLTSEAASDATVDTAECALGSAYDFNTGILVDIEPALTEFTSTSLTRHGSLGEVPTADCIGDWLYAETAVAEAAPSLEEVIAGVTAQMGDAKISDPQPLLDGQVFAYSYTNATTDKRATGAAWLYDRYLVKITLFVDEFEPQEVADWFAGRLAVFVNATADEDPDVSEDTEDPLEGSGVELTDAVLVNCDEDRLRVDVAPDGDGSKAYNLYDIDLIATLEMIGLDYAGGYCGPRASFNADFSAFLTYGWASNSAHHIALVDLTTATATDLTEPRQGTGFSDGDELDESKAWFQIAPGEVAPSSTHVVIESDPRALVDLSDPSTGEPYRDGYDDDALGTPTSYEYDEFSDLGRSMLSPDGTLILSDRPGSSSYVVPVGGRPRDWVDLPAGCDEQPHGWYDAQTAVVGEDDQAFLVHVNPDASSEGCTPVLPETDRDLQGVHLSLDRTELFVAVESSNGADDWDWFIADLAKPGGEPRKAKAWEVSEEYVDAGREWEVFFPLQR